MYLTLVSLGRLFVNASPRRDQYAEIASLYGEAAVNIYFICERSSEDRYDDTVTDDLTTETNPIASSASNTPG